MHVSCKSVSDGERYAIVLVVSLVLCGEAVAQVRIPTRPCIHGSHDDTQISTRLPLPRLWTCQSTSALIVCLGTTPIYMPFRPQCVVSII